MWNPFSPKLPAWPSVDFDVLKRRARVLVIDDDSFAYLELFRRDDYTLEKWDDIDDLPKLEAGHYDIILLDIQGVGTQQSQEQGLGVLRHLKRVSPAQIVVAYSNADYSLKYRDFFDLADATLDKRADYVDFKEVIDEQIARRFSLDHYIERAMAVVGASESDSSELRTKAREAILRQDLRKVREYLKSLNIDSNRAELALQIIQVGIGALQLLLMK
jgi:CheY-like chemotaxis protein